jgi:hypothetical protein
MRQSFHQTTNFYSADVFGGLGRNDVLEFDYGWTFNKVWFFAPTVSGGGWSAVGRPRMMAGSTTPIGTSV